MITMFTIPRRFVGQFDMIQRNSIASWQRLEQPLEIILLDEAPESTGVAAVAAELGVSSAPVRCGESGIPFVDSAIAVATTIAKHAIRAFVNADNIFLSDLLPSVRSVASAFDAFVIVGRRWNLDVDHSIDFSRPDWERVLREQVAERGRLMGHATIDYFIYRGDPWGAVLPFLVGRDRYDHWLLRRALDNGFPVIDATSAITMIHQNHGGKPWKAEASAEEEKDHNARLTGEHWRCSMENATHRLTPTGLEAHNG